MLTSEAAVVRTLAHGTMSLDQIYALCEQNTDVSRDNGLDVIHGQSDLRWHRRVRGALQALRRAGTAERIDRATWVIEGTPEQPRRVILVQAGGTLADMELRVQRAVELLGELDGPADLIVTDPPYGLGRGSGNSTGDRVYQRDRTKVVPGYVDVDPEAYEDFTWAWVSAAAEALRPAGQIAVVTGPQRSAVVQYVAEHSGLSYVNQIIAEKQFPLRTTSRCAHAHWTITVMVKPRVKDYLNDPQRTFNTPPDLPMSRTGSPYPLDWWRDCGRADRHGLLRYDNALPDRLVWRLVYAFSNRGDHVVDPFVGSGTVPRICHELRRRCTAGDENPEAIRFTMAQLLDEKLWPGEQTPTLFAV
jgi:DNA modification methylase